MEDNSGKDATQHTSAKSPPMADPRNVSAPTNPERTLDYQKGWQDCQAAITTNINILSYGWMSNGPSLATAQRIIKLVATTKPEP